MISALRPSVLDSFGRILCNDSISGTAYANVLPLPVSDWTIASLPDSKIGIVWLWTVVNFVTPNVCSKFAIYYQRKKMEKLILDINGIIIIIKTYVLSK